MYRLRTQIKYHRAKHVQKPGLVQKPHRFRLITAVGPMSSWARGFGGGASLVRNWKLRGDGTDPCGGHRPTFPSPRHTRNRSPILLTPGLRRLFLPFRGCAGVRDLEEPARRQGPGPDDLVRRTLGQCAGAVGTAVGNDIYNKPITPVSNTKKIGPRGNAGNEGATNGGKAEGPWGEFH